MLQPILEEYPLLKYQCTGSSTAGSSSFRRSPSLRMGSEKNNAWLMLTVDHSPEVKKVWIMFGRRLKSMTEPAYLIWPFLSCFCHAASRNTKNRDLLLSIFYISLQNYNEFIRIRDTRPCPRDPSKPHALMIYDSPHSLNEKVCVLFTDSVALWCLFLVHIVRCFIMIVCFDDSNLCERPKSPWEPEYYVLWLPPRIYWPVGSLTSWYLNSILTQF